MDYFDNYKFSKEIWETTYRSAGEETIVDTWKRLAKACALPEESEIRARIYEEFLDAMADFKFVPGGRIIANLGVKGREATTLYNCFVHHPKDIQLKNADSLTGIYTMLAAQSQTLKSEGGYGTNASWIRPSGNYVKGIGSRTPGVLKFMELWDKSSEIITMGSDKHVEIRKAEEKNKIRKGAQMLVLDVWHPEIKEFIIAKQTPHRLTKFNVSVGISDEFMSAVMNKKQWDLVFPDTTFEKYDDEWDGDIDAWKAKDYPIEIHETIDAVDLWNSIMTATYNRNEPGVLFLGVANRLNPLDWLEHIFATNPCLSGDTLIAVADGRNAITIKQLAEENKPVDVYSIDNGKVTIKTAIKVFKTKSNVSVVKITLDDGSTFKCTPDHQIMLRNGKYKFARDLIMNESLMPFNSYISNKRYRQISSNVGRDRRQYRMIAEFNNLIVDAKTTAIHHKDFDSYNDKSENFEPMSHEEHRRLHSDRIKGTKNPYYRMTDKWKHNFASHPGTSNGKYIWITNDELKEKIKQEIISKGRQLTKSEYRKFANENKLPISFSSFRKDTLGKPLELIKKLTIELGLKYYKPYELRKHLYQNHKVLSVELIDNEDVYDMIVPETNNFGIITSKKDDRFIESSGIFVHNCGEIPMPTGVCNLASMNLVKFIKIVANKVKFDYDMFAKYVAIGIRFLDNINDISRTPLKEYTKSVKDKRRIGLGTLGLGSLHLMMGIRYGSEESLELIESIFKLKAETELLISAKLGKEKGSFPLFDAEKYFSTFWWKNLRISKKVKTEIEEIGCMRNSHQSMNAPTGNTAALSQNVSSGIEPSFSIEEYMRWFIVPEIERAELRITGFKFPAVGAGEWYETDQMKFAMRGDEQILRGEWNGIRYEMDKSRGLVQQEAIEDYGWTFAKKFYKDDLKKMKAAKLFATTNELSVDDHINALKIMSHYSNMAISKTVNLPKDYKFEDFKDLYLNAYKSNIKGITTYREGTMNVVLETKEANDKAYEILNNAKKRPEVLDADIYVVAVKGEKFLMAVGLLEEKPYELFGGHLNGLGFKFKEKKGKITKVKRGQYKLEIGEDLEIEDFGKQFTPIEQTTFRLVSTSLRHGVPLHFIVEQLQKSSEDMFSMTAAAARVLKKYIDDGKIVSGITCPSCGSADIIYEEGCHKCRQCSWSKCL